MKFPAILFVLFPGILFSQSWEEISEKAGHAFHAGAYAQAAVFAQEAIRLAALEYGVNHENYFTSKGDYGSILKKLGRFTEALKIERENLEKSEQVFGTENLQYVLALKNIGNTYMALEEYQQAEFAYSRAITILGIIIARRDEYYSERAFQVFDSYMSINIQLGVLYQRLGRGNQAEMLYADLIDFCKQYLADAYADYGPYSTLLNNLASLLIDIQEYERAESYLLESLRITEELYSNSSPYYLQTKMNLAMVYKKSHREDEAERMLKEILEVIRQIQGTGNSDYITVLNNLSGICFEQERYSESEQYTLEALQWQEKNFGTDHQMYQTLVHNLAETYQWMKRFNEAERYYKLAVNKVIRDVEKNFTYLTESEKRNFYQNNSLFISEYAFFALLRSGALPLPALPLDQLVKASLGDLYNLQLNTKALVLNSTAKMKHLLLTSGDTALITKFRIWEQLKEEIARQYTMDVASRTNIDSLVQVAERYESLLNKTSAAFRTGFVNQPVTWQEIQQKLKPGEAAVELIRFFDGLIYAALIVTPQTKQHPEIALIKSTKTWNLEKEFRLYYKNAIRLNVPDTISYDHLWKPVYDTLRKYSTRLNNVYLSPDGMFNEINLNTLQNPISKKFVLDETAIHLVTNTREILTSAGKKSKGKGSAVLVGRPDYGEAPDSSRESFRSTYTDLKGTEIEVSEIAALLTSRSWNTTVFMGKTATEENIKSLVNPQIVHIATHGFFVPPEADHGSHTYLEAMLQSGIILANANNPKPDEEDGILTAYEAMNLNWDATQLVVLSACETGLGTIEAGEGVYGLQRTLKIAGAQSILMSLWKVDDTATQELMRLLYQNWLRGKSIRIAFRLAQQKLREKYPEPYYWGAFVILGD
jgi:CHAT domain-containing protein